MATTNIEVDGLKTFADVASRIKGKWLKARIAVGSCLGEAKAVKRLSLVENADGTLLVVLYEEEMKAK